jgi:hypothetical protein
MPRVHVPTRAMKIEAGRNRLFNQLIFPPPEGTEATN